MYIQEYTEEEKQKFNDAIVRKDYEVLFPWGINDLYDAGINKNTIDTVFDIINAPEQIIPEFRKIVIDELIKGDIQGLQNAFTITKFLAESAQYISQQERVSLYSEASELSIKIWQKKGRFTKKLQIYNKDSQPVKVTAVSSEPRQTRTIIILHGLSGSKLSKEYIVDWFIKQGFMVLRFDIQGHGERWDPMRNNIIEDTRHIIEKIRDFDFVNQNELYIFGHSLGGFLTLAMISELNIFKGAIAIAGFLDREKGTNIKELSLVQQRGIRFITQSSSKIKNAYSSIPNYKISEEAFTRSKTPLLIIHAIDDDVVPVKNVEIIKKLRPDAEDMVLQSGGHVIGEQWKKVLERISDFIKK